MEINREGSYSIEEIKKKNRGTKIFFKLKESAKEFAQEFKVKETINKYSNFAEFPIFFKKEKVNTVSALWHKKASEIKDNELHEFYKFITNDFEDPLGHVQLSLEGAVNFKALMFIPKTAPSDLFRFHAEKSLHLYSNKILIQHDCKELLPDHMRFMRGVVDTVDLPLNVSRETVQSSPVMSKIKDVLAGRILGFLKNWAENDVEKYVTFYRNFGAILKIGLNSDFTNRDKLVELMRYETSLKPKGAMVSLKDYASRMPESQKEIYYLSGDSREVLEKNPNLEYFNKHNLEVLLLSDPTDIFTFPSINNYEKKPIKSIDKADIDLKPEDAIEKPDNAVTKSLVALFKEALGGRVEDVVESKRLVESAVTLVSGKQSMDPQMEKMMRMMNKDYQKQKKIIEVNMTHPLIRNLTKKYIANAQDPFIKKCMLQMYEGALFIDGELPPSADFVKRMTEIMEEASA